MIWESLLLFISKVILFPRSGTAAMIKVIWVSFPIEEATMKLIPKSLPQNRGSPAILAHFILDSLQFIVRTVSPPS